MIDWQRYKDKVDLNLFKRILTDCLDIQKEKVLIVGDYGTSNKILAPLLTNSYALASRELNLNYSVFLQHSKVRGDFADEVLISTLRRLPKESTIIMNVSNRIGKLGSLGLSFRKYCQKHNHKFITSSSLGTLSNDHLRTVIKTMDVDYKKMESKGQKIKRMLDNGREVNLTTNLGTDLTIDITDMPGIVNSGVYNKFGTGGNLPAGETYICPVLDKAEGKFVIDGSLRLRDKTILVRNPVTVNVEKGSMTTISNNYEGKLFKATLEWAHRRAKRPQTIRKIAELGIGFNPNAKVIGATIIDEKTQGTIHIANGSNSWFGGEIKSIIHLDHVIKNPIIRIDGRTLRVQ